ncbi:hypothetical protein N431DRAFT_486703 [Stipitochalara longipes BDJ]|nr:hypothetical protein N431DRAFT_486703 [Stipitochalara longipes BDJ]
MTLTAPQAKERLLGAWQLLSFTTTLTTSSGATIRQPMGDNPLGRLLFTPDGWISTFGNDSSNMIAPSGPWITATDAELALVARCMMSYIGKYKIFVVGDGEVRLSTEVHVSLDPSWVGTTQERKVELRVEEGRELVVLSPVEDLPAPGGGKGTAVLVWEKILSNKC